MSEDRNEVTRDAHDISGAGDRYEALVEVLQHQTSQAANDRAREQEQLRRSQEQRDTPWWLVGVLLLLTAWLWIFPPGILRVDQPPPQPVAQEEAALRFTIYVQAQRIKAFREETGRYPDRLEEVGPPLPGMQYARLAPSLYQLTAVTDRLTLTYRSDLPLEEFVGSGATVIDESEL